MIKKRQFNGVPFPGILYQKAQRVDAPERGISYSRPDRYLVNTPTGQLEIGQGDWVVAMPSGSLYVVKDADIAALTGGTKPWWRIW